MHYAHHHHLKFKEQVQKEFGEEDIANCNGCGLEIVSCGFGCSTENCSFLLHEFCAFLPKEMKGYPNHPEHPLTLYTHFPSDRRSHFDCNVCERNCSLFCYHCEVCHYNVGIKCASISFLVCGGYIHKHELTAQLYPASFLCCFCGKKHSELGMSYQCRTCSYWIHEQCYSLPLSIKHDSHPHSLELCHLKVKVSFGVCGGNIKPGFHNYGCGTCNYYIDIKCSTKKWNPPNIEMPLEQDKSIVFPLSSTELVQDTLVQFIRNICQWKDVEDKNGDTLHHPGHDHPLTLEFDSSKFIRSIGSDNIAKRGEYDVCKCMHASFIECTLL